MLVSLAAASASAGVSAAETDDRCVESWQVIAADPCDKATCFSKDWLKAPCDKRLEWRCVDNQAVCAVPAVVQPRADTPKVWQPIRERQLAYKSSVPQDLLKEAQRKFPRFRLYLPVEAFEGRVVTADFNCDKKPDYVLSGFADPNEITKALESAAPDPVTLEKALIKFEAYGYSHDGFIALTAVSTKKGRRWSLFKGDCVLPLKPDDPKDCTGLAVSYCGQDAKYFWWAKASGTWQEQFDMEH